MATMTADENSLEAAPAPCYCRDGITHWLAGQDTCGNCKGSLTAGPWEGEELVYGRMPQIQAVGPQEDDSFLVLTDD